MDAGCCSDALAMPSHFLQTLMQQSFPGRSAVIRRSHQRRNNYKVVMKDNVTRSDRNDPALLKNSALYKEFLAEREEILRHKWIESEKIGRDIGFERALLDWIIKYRAGWRAQRQRDQPASQLLQLQQ